MLEFFESQTKFQQQQLRKKTSLLFTIKYHSQNNRSERFIIVFIFVLKHKLSNKLSEESE